MYNRKIFLIPFTKSLGNFRPIEQMTSGVLEIISSLYKKSAQTPIRNFQSQEFQSQGLWTQIQNFQISKLFQRNKIQFFSNSAYNDTKSKPKIINLFFLFFRVSIIENLKHLKEYIKQRVIYRLICPALTVKMSGCENFAWSLLNSGKY